MLAPFLCQRMIALDCAARSDAPCNAAAPSGQTGLIGVARRGYNERTPGRDPVGVGTPWVSLGSADQLGCLQTL
jgi:hypothetical protein